MSLFKPGLVFIFLVSSLSSVSCQKIQGLKDDIDHVSFSWTGGTVFGEPFQVTTKQLHFDTGDLFGKDVILEGDILERGDLSTHLVMADQEGRMLVVLTGVDDSYRILDLSVNYVKILGRLERGKKGLPYLLAKAVRPGVKSSQ